MNTYYIAGFPVSDELYHHGVLGQKWGVRRYQNPDGTLTPEGKARYAASLYRGKKALDRNKNRGSGYRKAALKTVVRGLTVAGINSAVKNGMKFVIGGIGVYSPAIGATAPALMPAILAVSAALTVKDLYKAIRQDNDIYNAYEAGIFQKKYRKTIESEPKLQ